LNTRSFRFQTLKKGYQTPQLNLIELDNDISLTMQSFMPPYGPEEASYTSDLITEIPI